MTKTMFTDIADPGSTELTELIRTERDIIFNEQLKSCQGFVIINK